MASFRLPLAHEDFAGQLLVEFFPDGLASMGRPDRRQGAWVSLRGELKVASGQAKTRLKQALIDLGAKQFTLKALKKIDWARQYKSRFPIQVIGRFAIVPKWKKSQAPKAKLPILLTPGQGFGTGLHPSTRLMLRRLASLKIAWPQVRLLDVGAGSGILALGALRLGAKACVAIEIEEAACEEISENRQLNRLAPGRLKVFFGAFPRALKGKGHYEIICANIVTPVLEQLMPSLKARLGQQGILLMSGIHTSAESARVMKAAKRAGLSPKLVGRSGQWFVIEAGR